MEDLVAEAVKDVNADEPCIDIQVTAGTVKDVVALLGDPNAELPEIWIPDSPTWKGQLTAAGWTGTPIADVLAQTPVGLVGGPAAKAPASWASVLDGGNLAMADPSAEGASALALLAPYAEMKKTGETPASIEEKTVPVAQTYGERAVAGSASETDLSTITASTTQLVPTTEKAYLAARRSNDQLALVAPQTGVPMLRYPLIDVNRGTKDILASGGDLSARVGRALTRWFTSSAGVDAIAAAELRGPDGAPLPNEIGLGDARVLSTVAQKTTDDALRQWRVLSVPSSILAVVDLSGSMKTAIGDTTRIKLAVQASQVALDAFPAQARIGIWGFSKNRGEGASPGRSTPRSTGSTPRPAAPTPTATSSAARRTSSWSGSAAGRASWTPPWRPTSTPRRSGTRRGSTPWSSSPTVPATTPARSRWTRWSTSSSRSATPPSRSR
jgi:hypothetical protein